jgi:hypothetical protein
MIDGLIVDKRSLPQEIQDMLSREEKYKREMECNRCEGQGDMKKG